MNWLNLKERTVFIIGAAGGIGRAVAQGFADQGARLVLLDRDAEGLKAVADQLETAPLAMPLDLSDLAAVESTMNTAADLVGAPGILVNVAAMSTPALLAEVSEAAFHLQMTVNTTAALVAAQVFRRRRDTDRPAAIVNISSIAAQNPVPNGAAYSASKAALTSLTRQLAVEWGPEGIRCNLVSPGLILTPLSENFYSDPKDRKAREDVVPVRRIGLPQDIADAVLYLASDRASYVSGADVVVDGAFTQTLMTHIPRKRMT